MIKHDMHYLTIDHDMVEDTAQWCRSIHISNLTSCDKGLCVVVGPLNKKKIHVIYDLGD